MQPLQSNVLPRCCCLAKMINGMSIQQQSGWLKAAIGHLSENATRVRIGSDFGNGSIAFQQGRAQMAIMGWIIDCWGRWIAHRAAELNDIHLFVHLRNPCLPKHDGLFGFWNDRWQCWLACVGGFNWRMPIWHHCGFIYSYEISRTKILWNLGSFRPRNWGVRSGVLTCMLSKPLIIRRLPFMICSSQRLWFPFVSPCILSASCNLWSKFE